MGQGILFLSVLIIIVNINFTIYNIPPPSSLHIRACGQIFCDDCLKNKIALLHHNLSESAQSFSKLSAAQNTSDTDVCDRVTLFNTQLDNSNMLDQYTYVQVQIMRTA